MRDIIIACETLKDELQKAVDIIGCDLPIIWIDSDYHNDPAKLRGKLQQEIDDIENKDNILLVFGCCGNALVGIKANTANLVIPKTDDCISMVLSEEGKKFERFKETYFLTKGWIESPKSLAVEYERAIEKYGPERTKRIFKMMLNSYRYLMLIDTGAYNIDDYIKRARDIARITDLELTIKKGGIWFIKKLLKGPHDEDFCLIPKGGVVKISHFGYDSLEMSQQMNLF